MGDTYPAGTKFQCGCVLENEEYCENGCPLHHAPPISFKSVECPDCHKRFDLNWKDYNDEPETVRIGSCLSGGVYKVEIQCPHCDYKEEI